VTQFGEHLLNVYKHVCKDCNYSIYEDSSLSFIVGHKLFTQHSPYHYDYRHLQLPRITKHVTHTVL